MSFSKNQLKNYATGKRLLIVDDNKMTRKIFENFFKSYFSFVVLARDGIEALRVYDKYRFDLIISDVKMPKMDGIEFSRIIKDKNPDQPIIIISSVEDKDSFINLIDIGVDAFVQKPLKGDILGTKVVNILEHQFFRDQINAYNNKVAIDEFIKKNNISLHHKENTKSVSEVKKEKIAQTIESETPKEQESEYSAKVFMEKATKAQININDTISSMLESLEMLEDNVSKILLDGVDEDTIEELARIFSNLYGDIQMFDDLNNIGDTIFEIHEFFLAHANLDDFSEDQIDAFEMVQFILDDISNIIYGIFIKQNIKDIRVHENLLKNSVEQIKLKLSSGAEINYDVEFF
jgi:DNA-binding response OmpR family regulator